MAAQPESKLLPFGLGALPVNPVFLVGGAGLLLLLLGVLALLRRRSGPVDENDALEVAETSQPEEDNLLFELEAVAAELADERSRTPERMTGGERIAVPDGGMKPESRTSDVARSGPESFVEERIAELWQDEGDRVPKQLFAAESAADDDAAETTFDIADLAADREADPKEVDPERATDEAIDRFNRFFRPRGTETVDTDFPGSAPAAGVAEPSEPDPGIAQDEKRHDLQPAALHDQLPADAESATAGTRNEGVARSSGMAAERSVDLEPGPGDDGKGLTSNMEASLDETTDGGDSDAFSIEDIGADEVQTKIDLAQVYMEMGDTESARGFLEAVLAEGDAAQQDTAREMLSKLA